MLPPGQVRRLSQPIRPGLITTSGLPPPTAPDPSPSSPDNQQPLFELKPGWISPGPEIWDLNTWALTSQCAETVRVGDGISSLNPLCCHRGSSSMCVMFSLKTPPVQQLFTVKLMIVFGLNKRLRGPGIEITGRLGIICLGLTSHAGSLQWLRPPLVRYQRSEEGEKCRVGWGWWWGRGGGVGCRERGVEKGENGKISHMKYWLIQHPVRNWGSYYVTKTV